MPLLSHRHFKDDDRHQTRFSPRAAPIAPKLPIAADKWTDIQTGKTVLSLLSSNMTPGAEVDSSERFPPPRCYPGTRNWITTSIFQWMSDDHRQSDFCWFWGVAGTGKSAVAQTVAEIAAEDGQLGATYFFSRLQGRDNYARVWATIAYQLAVRIPGYRRNVAKQLANDFDILNKAPSIQFKRLIADPLAALPPSPKYLVVLDGLDECQSEEAQLDIIELIASITKSASSSPLVWMVCSRPEQHIRALFSDTDFPIGCWKLELSTDSQETKDDVNSYFRSCFRDMREQHHDTIGGLWPSEEDIHLIMGASSGLFAFASAIVRYINDTQLRSPKGRLESLLHSLPKPDSYHQSNPIAQLDLLYTLIMSGILKSVRPILILRLLRTCILYPSLSTIQVANLLGLDRLTFYHNVQPLRSLVSVPEPDRVSQDAPRFFHASFADFVLHDDLLYDGLRETAMNVTRTEVIYLSTRLMDLQFIEACFRVLAQTTPQHAMNLAWSPTKADGISAFSVSRQLLNYCAANVWSACLRLGDIDDPTVYETIINFRYPFLRFVKDKIPKSEFLTWIESLRSQIQAHGLSNIIQPIETGTDRTVVPSGASYSTSVRCFLLGSESKRVLVLVSPELLIFEYPVVSISI